MLNIQFLIYKLSKSVYLVLTHYTYLESSDVYKMVTLVSYKMINVLPMREPEELRSVSLTPLSSSCDLGVDTHKFRSMKRSVKSI